MIKRNIVTLVSAAALAGVAAPALAGSGLGFDPYYIENPYGREVQQSHAGATAALGYDPWYVPGRVGRDTGARSDSRATERSVPAAAQRFIRERRPEAGHAYAPPAFGPQADA